MSYMEQVEQSLSMGFTHDGSQAVSCARARFINVVSLTDAGVSRSLLQQTEHIAPYREKRTLNRVDDAYTIGAGGGSIITCRVTAPRPVPHKSGGK